MKWSQKRACREEVDQDSSGSEARQGYAAYAGQDTPLRGHKWRLRVSPGHLYYVKPVTQVQPATYVDLAFFDNALNPVCQGCMYGVSPYALVP